MRTNQTPRVPMNGPETPDVRAQIPGRVGQAALAILGPLARLFVAHGVVFGEAEELLKRAFFEAGQGELRRAGIKPNVSRVSLSTGMHRRDVKRLSDQEPSDSAGVAVPADAAVAATRKTPRSLASELYLRWSTDPALADTTKPLRLRATPGEMSFDSLAREVNTDAHPRSLLEELRRLGLVQVDDQNECVYLKPGGFVPLLERTELLGLLGENVSAHIDTAVGNVIDNGAKWLEQAIYENNLTPRAVALIDARCRQLWKEVSLELVPLLTNAPRTAPNESTDDGSHVRIGMYMYTNLPRTENPDTAVRAGNATKSAKEPRSAS